MQLCCMDNLDCSGGRFSFSLLEEKKKQKEKHRSKGISTAAAVDKGLCPLTPPPFEKGGRKL